MFAEDVVPGKRLVGGEKKKRGEEKRGETYHSVSAFGSSIGTDMRSSTGAAIVSLCLC